VGYVVQVGLERYGKLDVLVNNADPALANDVKHRRFPYANSRFPF